MGLLIFFLVDQSQFSIVMVWSLSAASASRTPYAKMGEM